MTAKTARDLITNKLGFKVGVSKSDTDLEKLRTENSALKKAVEEISKGKGKLADMERSQLMEEILELRTENEKNSQNLVEQSKEISRLRERLKAKDPGGQLNGQLEAKAKEAERREQLYNALSQETECLKKQLYSVTAKCVELENKTIAAQISQASASNCPASTNDPHVIEIQLKDALEKNQQWLVYDQQREAYVQGLVSKIQDVEQQLATATQKLQKKGSESNPQGQHQEEKLRQHERLLSAAKKDLEAERKRTDQLSVDLSELNQKYEERKREVMSLNSKLHSQLEQQQKENEIKHMSEKIQRLKCEVELSKRELDEERKLSADLSSQIQERSSQLENEKLANQSAQQQNYKLRKELRKAKEQMRSQPMTHVHEFRYAECNGFNSDDRVKILDQNESPRRSNLLDESFLECPKCNARYPTSQHRELLAHIDYCDEC